MHDLAGGDGHKLVAVGRLGRTVIGSEVEGRRLLLLTGCVNSLVEGVLSTAAAQHGEAWLEVATGGLTVGPGLQGQHASMPHASRMPTHTCMHKCDAPFFPGAPDS